MKKYLPLIFGLFTTVNSQAQHLEWRTGIRDTSYSSQSDFRSNKKKYPDIKLVQEQKLPGVTEKRNLVYAKAGQRELHLDAFTPKSTTRTAAVILIHGGGWRSGDRSQHIPLAQHLAAKGVASFTVEYRLSTEAFYPAGVFDVKASVRWLKANAKKYNVDTSKIAVLGFSAGGQLASLVGVTAHVNKLEGDLGNNKYSSSVNAVIDIDGTLSFIHPESWEAQNLSNVGASAMWIGYPRTERLDLWAEASPDNYTPESTIPFLFLNSSVERMHAGRDDFRKNMEKKGVYTEVVSFKDSPHGFCLYEPWFDPMVNNITSFLAKVFK
ncbi:alpha/beta hydrolase [Pedobacter duraquae]|nr:alpha/beta hydrolase [Pedobacter duraquae]